MLSLDSPQAFDGSGRLRLDIFENIYEEKKKASDLALKLEEPCSV